MGKQVIPGPVSVQSSAAYGLRSHPGSDGLRRDRFFRRAVRILRGNRVLRRAVRFGGRGRRGLLRRGGTTAPHDDRGIRFHDPAGPVEEFQDVPRYDPAAFPLRPVRFDDGQALPLGSDLFPKFFHGDRLEKGEIRRTAGRRLPRRGRIHGGSPGGPKGKKAADRRKRERQRDNRKFSLLFHHTSPP